MKNKKILLIIAVVLIALAGTFFVFKDKIFVRNSSISSALSGSPKTLKDILGLGTAVKCTYPGGTIYVSGERVRGDFNPINTEGVATHMITDKDTSYIWTDDSQKGYKMAFSVEETSNSEVSDSSVPAPISPVTPEDYSCGSWVVDSSLFQVPANIEFIDPASMIQTGAFSTCSYCDSLSGEEEAQCLSSLNCE